MEKIGADREISSPFSVRIKSAGLVYALSKEMGIRGSVVRLLSTNHGAGDRGMILLIVSMTHEKRFVIYIGDGSARWPACHCSYVMVLFCLALEKVKAGATYHAVAEDGVPMKNIMTVVGKHLDLPLEGKPLNEAVDVIGVFALMWLLPKILLRVRRLKRSWDDILPSLDYLQT